MDSLVAYAFQLLLGLVTLTHVQPISFTVIDGYVNKTETARLVCSVGTTINDAVAIIRNSSLAFDCIVPTLCVSQGLSSDYSVSQNVSAGITVMTILNADKDRDGVDWTCRYGSSSAIDGYVTLYVASPATSTRLIEEDGNITLELTCIYPAASLDLEFTLGNVIYSEAKPIRTGFQVCTRSHEASVNYTLTFQNKHLNSYTGTFKVYVNNTLYIRMVPGSRIYTFTAEPPTTTTTTLATTTTTMTTTLNITLTLSGTQTFSRMTSSNTQIVSTQNSSVSTLSSSDTQTFPIIPVANGVAVFILLIVIIIICRCCYLSRHRKEIRTKQQHESELEATKNPTIPEYGTPNPAYQLHQF